jgi:ferric-dicitrate binding protein FerR (iron transport regulator)
MSEDRYFDMPENWAAMPAPPDPAPAPKQPTAPKQSRRPRLTYAAAAALGAALWLIGSAWYGWMQNKRFEIHEVGDHGSYVVLDTRTGDFRWCAVNGVCNRWVHPATEP